MIMTRENQIPVVFPEDVKFKNYEWKPEPVRCPVLIPFWDMANHKLGEISTFLYPEIDAMVSSAMEDFKAGEQLFIMYGKRTNAQALIHNGWVEKEEKLLKRQKTKVTQSKTAALVTDLCSKIILTMWLRSSWD